MTWLKLNQAQQCQTIGQCHNNNWMVKVHHGCNQTDWKRMNWCQQWLLLLIPRTLISRTVSIQHHTSSQHCDSSSGNPTSKVSHQHCSSKWCCIKPSCLGPCKWHDCISTPPFQTRGQSNGLGQLLGCNVGGTAGLGDSVVSKVGD